MIRLGGGDGEEAGEGISIAPRLGGPEVVFDWSAEACGPESYPDLPTRVLRDASGGIRLILSHYVNYSLVGPDLEHLAVDCGPLLDSVSSPDPATFNDRRWLASLWTEDGVHVAALVHDEYQGHRHPGRCPSGVYERCWYNALTLAASSDGGATFSQAIPSTSLVASSPYPYTPDVGPVGVFAPSNIVTGPDGALYALAQVTAREAQLRGSCLLRTENPFDPGAWRAWDGTAFSVDFADPYRESITDPAARVCAPVDPASIAGMHESLTYNEYLGQYLLVGFASPPDPDTGEPMHGIYYSLSENLIDWSDLTLLTRATTTHNYRCGGPDPVAYPALVDPESSSPVFETTGQRPYLYLTKFNYEGCTQTSDRDLIRVPLVISG